MNDASAALDGNAAAGILAEIFRFEMTASLSTCAGCGRTAPIGSLIQYGGQMGTILRCSGCERVQLRVVRAGGRYWVDMQGISALQLGPSAPVTP